MTLAQHIANFAWPIAIAAAFAIFVICKRNQIEWGE